MVDGERDATARVWYVTGCVCIWLHYTISERHLEPKQLLGRRDVQPHRFDTSAPTTTYTISGTVSGSPATVTLSGALSQSTTTDAMGNYKFSGYRMARMSLRRDSKLHLLAVNGLGIDKRRFGCRCEFQRDCCAHSDAAYRFAELDGSTSTNVMGYNVYRARSQVEHTRK